LSSLHRPANMTPPCSKESGSRGVRERGDQPPHVVSIVDGSPASLWSMQEIQTQEVVVTRELLDEAMRKFERRTVPYLHQVVLVAFPHLPTQGAARRAMKRGDILIGGAVEMLFNAPAPPIGTVLLARVGATHPLSAGLEEKLRAWNAGSGLQRPETQLRVLFEDADAGWGVVNKPAGVHSDSSWGKDRFTLEHYLPALVYPPGRGTRCPRPVTCHRLDLRVAGPVVVATSEEALRAIKEAFREHKVRKEYRAIVCGAVGGEGDTFSVDALVDGKPSLTDVHVLKVVRCPHYGWLSELCLRPLTGRYHQLRMHCAEELGAPIVNDDPPLFAAAASAWQRRHGRPLPPHVRRGKGNLFLQAVEVGVPAMEGITDGQVVGVEVSERFAALLQQSQGAWERGWRRADGNCCTEEAQEYGEVASTTAGDSASHETDIVQPVRDDTGLSMKTKD